MSHSESGEPVPVANPARAAWALYLIVFVSGAVLMGLEIAGAKILAPGFGTSTFVWGAIIGMFMGALAAGYYVGGSLADKNPSFRTLSMIVSAAAIWVFLLPRFGPGLAESIAKADMGKVLDPLVASMLLFFVPSFLMGMVSPFSVKLNASSLAGVGGVAGRLYALSTFGSIIGTWLTTFVLIPNMKLSNVLQLLGAILLLTAIVCLFLAISAIGNVNRSQMRTLSMLALVWLIGTESWAAFPTKPNLYPGTRLIRYEDSPYHEIQVTEEAVFFSEDPADKDGGMLIPVKYWDSPFYYQRRWLKFNENIESGTLPYKKHHTAGVTYTDLLHLPLIWNKEPKRILVVGGGGGIIPSQYSNWYNCKVDVAELDEKVAMIAQEYFDMPKKDGKLDPNIKFYIGDGRQTIRRELPGPYDVIVLDAYSSGGQIPFHLMTWNFLNEVKAKLAPNGILITNIISGLQNGAQADVAHNADLFLAEFKTLSASRNDALGLNSTDPADSAPLFKQLYVFPKFYRDDEKLTDGKLEEYRNVIVIATNETKRKEVEGPDGLEEIADKLSPKTDNAKDESEFDEASDKAYVKIDLRSHVKSYKRLRAEHVPSADTLEQFKVILTDDYAPVDLMYRPVKRDENMHRIR